VPLINGVKDLGKVTVEQVAGAAVRPLAEGTGKVAQNAARRVDWTLVAGFGSIALLGCWLVKRSYWKRRADPVGNATGART
jgi:hypothetical protein